jgi:predicted amidohydrolase YtcJ
VLNGPLNRQSSISLNRALSNPRPIRVIISAVMFLACVAVFAPIAADTFYIHANVHTVDTDAPHATCIGVSGDKIVFVGENPPYSMDKARVVDLHGATVVPGLTDSHFHIAGVGERELTFNLEGVASLQEFLARVKTEVAKAKPREWITGRGWIETFWKPQTFPTRYDLDKVSPNNPVYLVRADGHAGIANSEALRIAGIGKETKDPFGGHINRDAAGEATGMLLDGAQVLVVARAIRKPIDQDQALIKGSEFALQHGLCEVQVAGSSWSERDRLQRLVASGKIKVRIYDDVYGPGPDASRLIREGAVVGSRFTNRGIKVIFDGALGSRGAALLKPYSDSPETSGFFTAKPELVAPMLEEALRAGIQVETHAIGDRANRTVLDLYAAAMKAVPEAQRKVKKPRWRIEHAQIIDPSDIPRFGQLGVIASMQPSHAIGDLHFAPARLGQERLAGAYAWKALLNSGAIIAAGSDAPVERGDPRIEFYAAVSRRDLKGFTGPGWHPEMAVSREQALKMFTLWPAQAAFEERSKGSIEVGKLADFTVLDGDIMKMPLASIPKVKVLMTIVGGEVAFRSAP